MNTDREAKSTAKKIMCDAQNALGNAEECVRDSLSSAKTHIKDKPVKSALIALGVGFLIGKLLGN